MRGNRSFWLGAACWLQTCLWPDGAAAADCRFRVVWVEGAPPKELVYTGAPNARPTRVTFVPDRWSKSFEYRGPDTLVFSREIASPDGRSLAVAVARVAIPAGARQLALLFQPGGDPARNEEFSVLAFEETRDAFPIGSLRVLNLSTAPLLTKVDEQDVEVPSPGAHVFKYRPKRTGLTPFGLAVSMSDEWRVLVDRELVLAPDRRYFLIILPPVEADSLRVRLKLLEESISDARGE